MMLKQKVNFCKHVTARDKRDRTSAERENKRELEQAAREQARAGAYSQTGTGNKRTTLRKSICPFGVRIKEGRLYLFIFNP